MLVVTNLPAKARDEGDLGSIPGLGRSPGGGRGNLLQYSCPENPVDIESLGARVHGVAKSQIQLKQGSMHTCFKKGKNQLYFSQKYLGKMNSYYCVTWKVCNYKISGL